MNEMKKFLGYEFFKERNNSCCSTSLSYKQRIFGFVFCFTMGLFIQFLSIGSTLGLLLGETYKFSVLYTLGNIFSIGGTMFLIGPLEHLKKMMETTRIIVSLIYMNSIIMTLISVFYFHSKKWTLIFLIIQFLSYTWYCLSYIPFGRCLCLYCAKVSIKKLIS